MKLDSNLISFISILLIILISVVYLGFYEDKENEDKLLLTSIIKDNRLLTENFENENGNENKNENGNEDLNDEIIKHMSLIHTNPNANQYIRRSEMDPDDRCTVSKAEDRDKYLHKSDIPSPPPDIDMNKYILKSSIPPEKVCPPQKEIDYSKYVLKSTIPPPQKCPSCICPKVKVSAGLCQKCPPPPKCPAPEACPPLPNCPTPRPCPAEKECPEACPAHPPVIIPKSKVNPNVSQIKYIKVPTVITKTKVVDSNGNVINEEITTSEDIPKMKKIIPDASMSDITKQAIQLLNRGNVDEEEYTNDRLSYKCDLDNDLNSQQKKYMGFSDPYLLN